MEKLKKGADLLDKNINPNKTIFLLLPQFLPIEIMEGKKCG